jgi:hypothetical protein
MLRNPGVWGGFTVRTLPLARFEEVKGPYQTSPAELLFVPKVPEM